MSEILSRLKMRKGIHPLNNSTILINSIKGSYSIKSTLNNKKIKYELDQYTQEISNPLIKKIIIKDEKKLDKFDKLFLK